MHEAVLEDRLGDGAGTLGNRVHGGELRLHIGRKGRIGSGGDVHRARPAPAHVEFDPVRPGADVGAGLGQLVQHRIEDARLSATDPDAAAGHRAGDEKSAGLDAIRQHAMLGAAKPLHPLDGDDGTAGAGNAGAHAVEKGSQVDDFRFARRVLDHRGA